MRSEPAWPRAGSAPAGRCRARPTGAGVRHQPGHRAPGARPAAPGGPRHQPAGRRMVRRLRSGAPAPRPGHDGRGRGRSRGRDAGPPDPRVRVRPGSRAVPRARSRCGDRCRRAARRATEPRRRRAVRARRPYGCAAISVPSSRAPTSSARRSTTCCRCAASRSARCNRRSRPRSPTARLHACSTPTPGRPLLLVARRVTCDADGDAGPVLRAPLPGGSHHLRDRVLA